MEKRIHIFNAGPAALPPEVLLEAKEHFFNFHGEGLSLMEMSHRGKTYDGVHFEAMNLMKAVMHLPDNYKVMFMQGGASLQFAALPFNLAKPGQLIQYVDTGAWSTKAIDEAENKSEISNVVTETTNAGYLFWDDFNHQNLSF